VSAAPSFEHEPVLLSLVVELFAPVPAGVVVDATVGGGGHAAALLDAHPHISILGLDQDPAAVAAAQARLRGFGDRAVIRRARFDQLAATLRAEGHEGASGALFDLGVSSHQFDRPERGFSYRADGPLDMRMDPDAPTSADEIVNAAPSEEIARILRSLGDERYSTRIARAIVAARPIRGTEHLA
jgi:16S rRNA (cytosine1402-N4)-methyltransferase